jgi:predicted restriction endonuclease
MEYKIYKQKIEIDEYFSKFDNCETLSEDLKISLYDKYLLKYNIFNRDRFTCQNDKCKYCNNKKDSQELTIHHVKWKKNGGEDDIDNCVTLCKYSHTAFHNGRIDLKIANNKLIPKSIRGNTFKVSFRDKVLAKERKSAMKKLRKQIDISIKKYNLTWQEVSILLSFLELK